MRSRRSSWPVGAKSLSPRSVALVEALCTWVIPQLEEDLCGFLTHIEQTLNPSGNGSTDAPNAQLASGLDVGMRMRAVAR